MKNKFAQFLYQFSTKDIISEELDDFVGNSKGRFNNNSGGPATLAGCFQENIQDALIKTVTYQLKSKVTEELRLHEVHVRNNLLKELVNNIDAHATISKDANFSNLDVANHFIAEIYNPLLTLAKEIIDDLDSPLSMNNEKSFVKTMPI